MSRIARAAILENAVMDRHDAGQPMDSIARDLNCKTETVDRIISYMQVGNAELKFGSQHLARCSRMLVAAIARHHPDRIAS